MNRHERRAAARKTQTVLNGSGADTPAALHEAGFRHLRAGQYLEAQICCERSLAADPNHADTLHLMGLLSHHAMQYDAAAEWTVRAIRQDPRPEFLSSLGTTLQQQGKHEEALKVFDKAVQLKPDDAELWRNLGNVMLDLKRSDEALRAYQQALKVNPRDWEAARKSGILFHQAGRLQDALSCFDLCDQLQPNEFATHYMRGRTLIDLERLEEALAVNRQAHALDPREPRVCNNIGVNLRSLGRDVEALPWFDLALKLAPNSIEALNNRAVCLFQIHRFDESLRAYEHALAVDPGNAEIEWNTALLHMLMGNFEAGWAGLEARWRRAAAAPYPAFTQPKWLGEQDIEGKTILICSDEGLGDSIQLVRYVPLLAARGARIILFISDPLYPLFSGLPHVAQCLPLSARALPAFDLHCPMGSLPLAFGTRFETIPSATPYLPAPAEGRVRAWEDRLGRHDKLRVGLVWSGNPKHKNDHNRSARLQTLLSLLDVDATFVSLQKEPRPVDQAVLRERTDIVDLTAHLTDFAETAALVSCLDLVITVDTSVAHLAGALGRPTWILLPYTPDYRWLLDRDDSPWYPTVKLFRQTETRDYADVLDRVREQLLARIAAFESEKTR
jgi:tetratricopeptide (TPR) repeat protein